MEKGSGANFKLDHNVVVDEHIIIDQRTMENHDEHYIKHPKTIRTCT